MPEVNKVVYYGDTLIDLTNDTAEASDVVAGKYFHLANGERASGTANYAPLNHDHDDRYYTESETDALLDEKADTADLGDLAEKDTVDWDNDIDNIPSTFPPSTHNHDDRYYTESEIDTTLNMLENNIFDFKRYRTLTDFDDLNALDQEDSSGVYYFNFDSTFSLGGSHSPVPHGVLYNFRKNLGTIYQFIIYNRSCYFRDKYLNIWSVWYEIKGFSSSNPPINIVTENDETGFVMSSNLFSGS